MFSVAVSTVLAEFKLNPVPLALTVGVALFEEPALVDPELQWLVVGILTLA